MQVVEKSLHPNHGVVYDGAEVTFTNILGTHGLVVTDADGSNQVTLVTPSDDAWTYTYTAGHSAYGEQRDVHFFAIANSTSTLSSSPRFILSILTTRRARRRRLHATNVDEYNIAATDEDNPITVAVVAPRRGPWTYDYIVSAVGTHRLFDPWRPFTHTLVLHAYERSEDVLLIGGASSKQWSFTIRLLAPGVFRFRDPTGDGTAPKLNASSTGSFRREVLKHRAGYF